MRITLATTLNHHGSTVTGRVIPLARELARSGNAVHVLLMHAASIPNVPEISFQTIGYEPFTRTRAGKQRRRGLRLLTNMVASALRTAWALRRARPDVVIIVKPLPANTLGTYLYHLIRPRTKIILDADDFELTANVLTSFAQRLAVQWSLRVAARLGDHIVVATPFLQDYFTNLVNGTKKVSLIVTGHTLSPTVTQVPTVPAMLYLGSVSRTSGHRVDLLPDILDMVLRVVPQAHLYIAGDGDTVESLKKAFRHMGIDHHVTWYGRFYDDEVGQLVKRCRVIIDPVDASVTARAKSSFRAMVSLAFAMPLVTSGVGIRSLLIPPQLHDRFFATPGDVAAYAQRIIEHLQHPLAPAQQMALHQAAQRYTWARLAKQYQAILTTI